MKHGWWCCLVLAACSSQAEVTGGHAAEASDGSWLAYVQAVQGPASASARDAGDSERLSHPAVDKGALGVLSAVRVAADDEQEEARVLDADVVLGSSVAFSPDGHWLAYKALTSEGVSLRIIDCRGDELSEPETIADDLDVSSSMEWAPRSRGLAFTAYPSGRAELRLLDVRGEEPAVQVVFKTRADVDLHMREGKSAWSKYGERLAFHERDALRTDLWVADLSTEQPELDLTGSTPDAHGHAEAYEWLDADDDRLLWSMPSKGHHQLFERDFDRVDGDSTTLADLKGRDLVGIGMTTTDRWEEWLTFREPDLTDEGPLHAWNRAVGAFPVTVGDTNVTAKWQAFWPGTDTLLFEHDSMLYAASMTLDTFSSGSKALAAGQRVKFDPPAVPNQRLAAPIFAANGEWAAVRPSALLQRDHDGELRELLVPGDFAVSPLAFTADSSALIVLRDQGYYQELYRVRISAAGPQMPEDIGTISNDSPQAFALDASGERLAYAGGSRIRVVATDADDIAQAGRTVNERSHLIGAAGFLRWQPQTAKR